MKKTFTLFVIFCLSSQLSIAQHEGYSSDSWKNQLDFEQMFANHIDKTSFKKHLKKLTERPHGGNTNNISKRAENLLTEFSKNGGVVHVSEGSFVTYGVNQENSAELLIDINNINWSYPKQLIQVSSNADIVFSY